MLRAIINFSLGLLLLGLLGCENQPTQTAIRVIVDSDLKVGSELTRLEVRIFDADGKTQQRKQDFALSAKAGPARFTLPMSFRLAPESQSSSYDFRIVVTGVGPLRPLKRGASECWVRSRLRSAKHRHGGVLGRQLQRPDRKRNE